MTRAARAEVRDVHASISVPRLLTLLDGVQFGAPPAGEFGRTLELVIPRWWDARRWLVWLFRAPCRVDVVYADRTRVHRARLV